VSAPEISVCIPARNAGAFLSEAVESALTQERVAVEVIVHDDASTDGSVDALPNAADRRLRVQRSSVHRGVAATRTALVAQARGRYVSFLDADDILLPDALARARDALGARADAVLVHGYFDVVDVDGRHLPDWEPPFPGPRVLRATAAFDELLASNFVTTSTATARRAALVRAGSFGRRIGSSSSDWDMWLRLSRLGDIVYLPERLARYRQHPESISSGTRASGERLRSDARVVRRALRSGTVSLRARRRARAALTAKAVIQAGEAATRQDRLGAVRAMVTAMRGDPRLCRRAAAWGLLADHAMGRELGVYRRSKRLMNRCARDLAGARIEERVRRLASSDPAYEASLERAAETVRRVVPRAGHIAAIDKWDPTLLALAGRRGMHFPDRRRMPDYPVDSDAAVGHLESLRADGVDHLVIPASSAWWLEHYSGLREHLERRYSCLCSDPDCSVWSLQQ